MLLLLAAALAAEPVTEDVGALAGASLVGTEDFRFRYWQMPERLPGFEDQPVLDYAETVNRLDLAASNGGLTLGLRADAVALWGNRYFLDDVEVQEWPLVGDGMHSPWDNAWVGLEKVYLQVRRGPVQVDVGDTYASLGRGFALNLVKNTDIDVDTSLRGVKAVAKAGDWDVTALSGVTNPQQVALENPNRALRPDFAHAVTAARVDRYGLGRFNLGAHGALFQFQRERLDPYDALGAYGGPLDAAVVGASAEAIGLGGVDWYLEGDWFDYVAEDIPAASGWAGYLSAAAYPGRSSVLVEAKRTKDTEHLNTFTGPYAYEMVTGPTLEYDRVITEDSAAAVNSNDLWGGRVRVDVNFNRTAEDGEPVTLIPYLSAAVFRDEDEGGLHFNRTPETIGHALAGLQWFHGELHVLLNAGARVDQRDPGADGADWGADRMEHADLALSVPIAGEVSVELAPSVLAFQWGRNTDPGQEALQQEDYLDFANALAVKVGHPWVFVLYTDYSTNPLIDSTGNLARLGLVDDEDWYGGLEAQWKPNSATTLKAFYGAYRAGIRCAGGQCRSLPGFEGAKLSLTTTF